MKFSVNSDQTQSPINWRIDFILIPILIAAVLLVGHYGLFFGETLLSDADAIISFDYQSNNSKTGGWRPDVALGQSFLMGDPGMSHAWALNRFFGDIFTEKQTGYEIQILFILWLSCFVLYLFIETLKLGLGRAITFILSMAIAFSSLRHEFSFIFIEVTVTCLTAMILYDFFKRPRVKHYFYYTSAIFLAAFLGSTSSVFKILIFTSFFSIGVAIYNKWYFFGKEIRKAVKNFLVLNLASGLSLLFLGAWIFFSIYIETKTIGYTRDPDYSTDYFFFWPGIKQSAFHFFSYLNAGLFPPSVGIFGISQKIGIHSWNNFSPLFPIIFLLMFRKSEEFWEFISKFIIISLFVFQEVAYWAPGVFSLFSKSMIYYPPGKNSPIIQVFEIVLTGIFISRVKNNDELWQGWPIQFSKIVSVFLIFIYSALFVFSITARLAPENLSKFINSLLSGIVSRPQSEIFSKIVRENIALFYETTNWNLIIFYILTILFLVNFFRRNWTKTFLIKNGLIFTLALFINNIFLAWAIYPLGPKSLFWEALTIDGKKPTEFFKPTDRLLRIRMESCSKIKRKETFYKCVNEKFFDGEFGSKRYLLGFGNTPALEFSKPKSATPKPVADFVLTMMRLEGIQKKGIMRSFANGENQLYASKLYNISGINYFISENSIKTNKNLELAYKSKQFYLYRNIKAWPYFYLAKDIKFINSYEDLYLAEKETAYLWEHDKSLAFPKNFNIGSGLIELISFKYGDLKFQYQSDEPELLVIADSWHPNWHATVNDSRVQIIKANGVFKGILLPPGEGTVSLFFDDSPYRFGILISIVAWVVFLSCWAGTSKMLPKIY